MVTAENVKEVITRGLNKLKQHYPQYEDCISIVFRVDKKTGDLLYIPAAKNTYFQPVSLRFLIGLHGYNVLVPGKVKAIIKRLAIEENEDVHDVMLLCCFKDEEEIFVGLYNKDGYKKELTDKNLMP